MSSVEDLENQKEKLIQRLQYLNFNKSDKRIQNFLVLLLQSNPIDKDLLYIIGNFIFNYIALYDFNLDQMTKLIFENFDEKIIPPEIKHTNYENIIKHFQKALIYNDDYGGRNRVVLNDKEFQILLTYLLFKYFEKNNVNENDKKDFLKKNVLETKTDFLDVKKKENFIKFYFLLKYLFDREDEDKYRCTKTPKNTFRFFRFTRMLFRKYFFWSKMSNKTKDCYVINLIMNKIKNIVTQTYHDSVDNYDYDEIKNILDKEELKIKIPTISEILLEYKGKEYEFFNKIQKVDAISKENDFFNKIKKGNAICNLNFSEILPLTPKDDKNKFGGHNLKINFSHKRQKKTVLKKKHTCKKIFKRNQKI